METDTPPYTSCFILTFTAICSYEFIMGASGGKRMRQRSRHPSVANALRILMTDVLNEEVTITPQIHI